MKIFAIKENYQGSDGEGYHYWKSEVIKAYHQSRYTAEIKLAHLVKEAAEKKEKSKGLSASQRRQETLIILENKISIQEGISGKHTYYPLFFVEEITVEP